MRTTEDIGRLVGELRSKDGTSRERARNELVKLGEVAVPFLVELLSDPNEKMRWEACKALGSISDPSAGAPLANLLADESVEIRWLAAEALVAMDRNALPPLLRILQTKFESPYVREGAHHILYALKKKKLLTRDTRAVLEALGYLKPKSSVAWAAHHALKSISSPD